MAKWLLVGDPHAVADELDDMQALIDGIIATVEAESPNYLVFLGDQHHNHALVHVEVLAFWRQAFKRLTALCPVYALVGNHDMPGDAGSKAHAMMAYAGTGVRVVDRAIQADGCLLLPYRHTEAEFLADLSNFPKEGVVFCHQTFDGSKFENGFFAKDAIDVSSFKDRTFISGHIHAPQRFDNVLYVGAPRWRSLSDIGVERALVLVEIVDGKLDKGKTFNTAQWCQKLVRLEDRQEAPLELETNPRWKYIIDIYGSEDYIKSRKARWSGCRVRTFPTQSQSKPVSESMGISKAIQVFTDSYTPKFGTSPEVLRDMVNKRLVGL